MKKLDYESLSEITVKNQEELDSIPLDFKGRIYIQFGTFYNRAVVKHNYYYSVEARGNSSVVAMENSSVVAMENSSVEAMENSSVVARGNSSVVARGNSSVVAMENSSVVAMENSSVEAMENSSVVARGNSSVVARGNVQVVDYLQGAKIQIRGNARIVYNPKTIHEYMDFYGIKHDKKTAIFYKAVHKNDGVLFSDHDRSFKYVVGENASVDSVDTNKDNDCGRGIHIAHLNWSLDFGSGWNDLCIIEVETNIDDIILPTNSNGKVRTKEVRVLREISLSECGVYGKIIEKRVKKGI